MSNKKFRMMKCGIALRGVGAATPTSRRLRSDYFRLINIDRIPYFDIHYSLFIIRYSLYQSFFSDQTGCFYPGAALV